MRTEKPKWKNHEVRVRKRDTGAEQPVVVTKFWKQNGAKGLCADGSDTEGKRWRKAVRDSNCIVSDRIAQMVVKTKLEPVVDPLFHSDSYGYRPGKSALDAVGQTRQRCWKFDWVIDLDIKGFFDNIDHELLMRAVRKHAKDSWVILANEGMPVGASSGEDESGLLQG